MVKTKVLKTLIIFLLFAVIFLSAAELLKIKTGVFSPKYNVILISLDSFRADHMSLYGYERKTTPNIDEFAENAFIAENYFSTAFLTPISEASVHTGYYPHMNWVTDFGSEINTKTASIAEILRSEGYRTAAFGSSSEFAMWSWGVSHGFKRGYQTYQFGKHYRDYPSISKIMNWIGQGDDPFYLWVPLGGAHYPYGHAPDNFVDTTYDGLFKNDPLGFFTVGYIYNNNIHRNVEAIDQEEQFPAKKDAIRISETIPLQEEDMKYIVDKYDDGIFDVDKYLGTLFSALEKADLIDNTIIVIQAEHGEELGEHQYVMHYDIFDTTVHTPLIIKLPDAKTQRSSQLYSGVDVLPTILDALDIKNEGMDGNSFLDNIKGKDEPIRDYVFLSRVPLWEKQKFADVFWPVNSALPEEDRIHNYQDTAIRNKKWKLIHRKARDAVKKYSWYSFVTASDMPPILEYELYDLEKDPLELNNVYQEHKEEVAPLLKELEKFETEAKERLQLKEKTVKLQPYR